MLYRVETGPHAGLDDTQGRKTAQHLRKALGLSVARVRQIKVFTVDGLDGAQVACWTKASGTIPFCSAPRWSPCPC